MASFKVGGTPLFSALADHLLSPDFAAR